MRTLTAAMMASTVMWVALTLINDPWNWAVGLAGAALIGVASSVRVEFRG